MARLTIHLPDEVEKKIRRDARRAKKTVSAFIAELLTKKRSHAAWAREVEMIYGSWVGAFPEIDDPPPRDLVAH